ncbi:hypothetical protein CDAR_477601 [Caerostris darwini]|uniref:Uncharacterized protein n=1 Tax=Caerostris darwini TaxID=1538125 RepID=A0AAV4RMR0_9ARAC|nr:hypothetical protein CDAR_477601 [Caerostris darwini]
MRIKNRIPNSSALAGFPSRHVGSYNFQDSQEMVQEGQTLSRSSDELEMNFLRSGAVWLTTWEMSTYTREESCIAAVHEVYPLDLTRKEKSYRLLNKLFAYGNEFSLPTNFLREWGSAPPIPPRDPGRIMRERETPLQELSHQSSVWK